MEPAQQVLPKDVIKEGLCQKQSRYLGWWKEYFTCIEPYNSRWLVLTHAGVFTFRTKQEYKNPTEYLALNQLMSVVSAEEETKKPNSFVRRYRS